MHIRMSFIASAFAVAVIGPGTRARAAFLDLATITVNLAGGTFTGSLDGITVVGTAGSLDGIYTFTGTGTRAADSTTDGSSPQYGYASVYSPMVALCDRVGFAAYPAVNSRLTITFGAPVTNPRFHIAGLDGAAYAFDLVGGLTSVSLVSGNGGGGDGLQVVGSTVSDADPTTFGGLASMFGGLPPTTPPPTTGPRSAYGTVSLNGTFTTLTATVTSIGDTGSFTLSSVPEPTAAAALTVAGFALLRRRRATA